MTIDTAQRETSSGDHEDPVHESAPGATAEAAGRRPRRLVLALVAAVTALLCAAAGWLVAAERQQQAVSDARTAALAQARTAAETVLSYDHASLDEDFRSALAVSTGEFAEEYRRTSDEVVRPLATKTQAGVVARVVDAGVVSASADRVVVLVFVNQTTTSNRLDAPKTDLNRVRMTMVGPSEGAAEGSGAAAWLVEKVEAL
ncbi:MAG TPA: hypothetical protein VFX41_08280 [Actinomycetales bacterium]|nr:hypothetical protein [Actinomycetales bacterium]